MNRVDRMLMLKRLDARFDRIKALIHLSDALSRFLLSFRVACLTLSLYSIDALIRRIDSNARELCKGLHRIVARLNNCSFFTNSELNNSLIAQNKSSYIITSAQYSSTDSLIYLLIKILFIVLSALLISG